MAGRPSSYNDDIAQKICDALVDSDYGLEQVCDENDAFPCSRTVYQWVVSNPAFAQRYAQAREAQGHVQADRANREALEATDPQMGRLRWDARRWQASKLAAKKYGDRVVQEHTGADGAPLPALEIKFVSAARADQDT